MIRQAEDGEKHVMLLKAAKSCGWIHQCWTHGGGRGNPCLLREISKRDIESESQAVRTIRDGH